MSTKALAADAGIADATPSCVIFPGALGDFICLLPALSGLARMGRVVLYAHSEFAEIVPSGVTVRSLEVPEISRLFVGAAPGVCRSNAPFDRFAQVYSWMGSQQPTFVEQLQRATQGRAKVFPFRPAERLHQMDYYLRCLESSAGLPNTPYVRINDDALDWCDAFCAANSLGGRSVLVIAPGSGAREKNWSEAGFIAVADEWREQHGGSVVLLIGPVESERGGIERLRQQCVVAADLSLAQAAALLGRSQAYLGNDSGISHLAAAVGAATVALFGPSDPVRWAPRGPRVTVICRSVDCSPCSTLAMKNCSKRICLEAISPREVGVALSALKTLPSLTRRGARITV
jgi:ADP-heptose:LPS heptosyltransferase